MYANLSYGINNGHLNDMQLCHLMYMFISSWASVPTRTSTNEQANNATVHFSDASAGSKLLTSQVCASTAGLVSLNSVVAVAISFTV